MGAFAERWLLRAAVAAAVLATGCGRVYVPRSPHLAHGRDVDLEVSRLDLYDGAPALAESSANVVGIGARDRVAPGAAIAFARVASADAPPCSGGVGATSEVRTSVGMPVAPQEPSTEVRYWTVDGYGLERQGLLTMRPTALDVSVLHADGSAPECLRVPLVDDPDSVQWVEPSRVSLGLGVAVVVIALSLEGGP